MKITTTAIAMGILAASGTAAAQTLQFDLNDLKYQVYNSDGNASGFDGVTHTGSVNLFFQNPFTRINALNVQTTENGSFDPVPGFTGTLTDVSFIINLEAGVVVGGELSVEVDGTDTYSAALVSGSGGVEATARGFTIDALTFDGAFSGGTYGGADISDWFAAQPLLGDLLTFKFNPPANGSGFADIDLFSTIPAPSAGVALAMAGLVATRRRR